MIKVTERGHHDTALGRALQLKIFSEDFRPLLWGEVWQVFSEQYPGRWAVQLFPPGDQLVDSKNVYHLWVCDECPEGLNLHT